MGNSSHDPPLQRAIQIYTKGGGCPFWRMIWPGYQLNLTELVQISQQDIFTRNIMDYARVNVIHVQKKLSRSHISFYKKLHAMKNRFNFRMVFELDDALFKEDIPDYNQAKHIFEAEGIYNHLKEGIELFDEVTVTTHNLKNYYQEKTDQKNFSVIPNYPPMFWIGREYDEEILRRNYRRYRSRPRILYAGSASHFDIRPIHPDDIVDDFTPVKEAVLSTLEKYQWIFVGAMPKCLDPFVSAGLVEFHSWKSMALYPRLLAALQVNMWIAPLMHNRFNECKSDLKVLEASALGHPIACQNISTYAIAPIKFDTGDEMLKRIDETLSTEESYINASREGRRAIQGRWLENKENIGKYLDLYLHPYQSERRRYLK